MNRKEEALRAAEKDRWEDPAPPVAASGPPLYHPFAAAVRDMKVFAHV